MNDVFMKLRVFVGDHNDEPQLWIAVLILQIDFRSFMKLFKGVLNWNTHIQKEDQFVKCNWDEESTYDREDIMKA